MPSPFPGMNPYLENPAVWPDFHGRFIYVVAEALTLQVSPKYVVRAEAQLYIHELPENRRRVIARGDLGIFSTQDSPSATAVLMQTAPISGSLPRIDIERIHFLEIRDRANRRVVTVIEILSPSNKDAGADRDQYLNKRGRRQVSGVNLVEIDLLRGGIRPPLEGLPPCDYYSMVSRHEDWPQVDLWPMQLRNPLPTIAIPLRNRDENATLDLQAILHRVYDAAAYEDDIYQFDPEPRLGKNDAEWAIQFVPNQ